MKTNIQALSPEWHAKRAACITATDVPAILGLSTYKSALDVYARITGKVPPEELEDAPYLRWGRVSEKLNAELFAEESGRSVTPCGVLYIDDERTWLVATPDFLQTDPARGSAGVLETKAPSIWKKDEWEEGVPLAFQVQTLVQMLCTGTTWGSCSALIPPEVVWGDVEPSPKAIDSIVTALERFWSENVLADTPPQVVDRNPELTLAALKRLHPKDNGATIQFSPRGAEAARELESLKLELKALSKRESELRAVIQGEIGGATFGVIPGTTTGYSWKHQTRNDPPKPAASYEFRVLRASTKIGG